LAKHVMAKGQVLAQSYFSLTNPTLLAAC